MSYRVRYCAVSVSLLLSIAPLTASAASGWILVSSPTCVKGSCPVSDVSALAPNDAWAVGLLYLGTMNRSTRIEHYDGTAWSLVSIVTCSV